MTTICIYKLNSGLKVTCVTLTVRKGKSYKPGILTTAIKSEFYKIANRTQ